MKFSLSSFPIIALSALLIQSISMVAGAGSTIGTEKSNLRKRAGTPLTGDAVEPRRELFGCPEELCDSGYGWDYLACACVPAPCAVESCPSGRVWDEEKCACRVTGITFGCESDPDLIPDISQMCQQDNLVFDLLTCTCTCPTAKAIECLEEHRSPIDPKTCECRTP
eukprot:CAMPEP_0194029026 /NCGR_PEP_ID=MMETSP0009_2-20130614/2888_1 /TAXON_ID=210454 /ORGANISM="Grammatophora oceanica, Strain CCMP 410" /LENGTH=166 /DNA_ID=CAMNT_0038668603 /DNA_START=36 /DNA_END=536 /DNA_ORIENTATION=+